ncbi:YCII-related domain-containing protein [Devosia lucknowensis]|uniref:YCII-related domain-containing protein n=1 Tax=Devosia lucknowensis TaxID=1096929 RepID=A0A1Y6F9T3_9HYPH|nr:YciI family protein [Devosia lucknowensis]SMQ71156.1 YCII-related domain-containing protein [Devosia lucknowensis]
MKFLTMVKTLNPETAGFPSPALMQAIVQLGMEAGAKMTETGGMALAGTVTTRKGQMVVDGPFAESKELVGGYAIYELETEAEIVDWTERFVALHREHWPEWDGEVTILHLQTFNMAG